MCDDNASDERISAVLRRLGVARTAGDATLLAGGQSGAAVYRRELDGERAILKLTRADAAPGLIAQARREARFYRELAPGLPIPVPRLIALAPDDDPDIAVLLAEYTPAGTIERWSRGDLLRVAQQLGRLHGTFWNRGDSLPDWVEAAPPITADRQHTAARCWQALGEHPRLGPVIDPYRPLVQELLARLPDMQARVAPMPATLCHGDCHAENYLRDANGGLVLGDWQQVRLGSGVDDLSFFCQRAFAASESEIPFAAMAETYAACLVTEFDLALPEAEFERQLAWSELRGWLIDWPEYLGFLPVWGVERILARIDGLRIRLDDERAN